MFLTSNTGPSATKVGEVYACGSNRHGRLGLGDGEPQNSPQKIDLQNVTEIYCGGYHSVALTSTAEFNETYTWGANDCGQLGLGHYENQNLPQKLNFPSSGESIIAISCGDDHTTTLGTRGRTTPQGSSRTGCSLAAD